MTMGFQSKVINKLEPSMHSILVSNYSYLVGFSICKKKQTYLVYLKGNNGFKFDFILM